MNAQLGDILARVAAMEDMIAPMIVMGDKMVCMAMQCRTKVLKVRDQLLESQLVLLEVEGVSMTQT